MHVAAFAGGAAAAAAVFFLLRSPPRCACAASCACAPAASLAAPAAAAAAQAASTTSSAQGTDVYETSKAVAEYLLFHFGAPADVLPYPASLGHHGALDFAARTGALCTEWARREGLALEGAFDVGCAVGGTSFELSRVFTRVVGLDFSRAFVDAANALKASGSAPFTFQVEGAITGAGVARVPQGTRPQHCTFMQGDACALPPASALGGPFTVVHAANLLCRLPDPM